MRVPTYTDTYLTLLLQAAGEGRGDALFGASLEHARTWVPPFLVGGRFPDVFLEHPLAGEPFLDVTVLLGKLLPGMRVASPAAGEHAAMLDYSARAQAEHPDVTCGFELDTKEQELSEAAVHFQPREHTELVAPFCATIGEEERARLYLDQAARMPQGWPLSFFGMFRGRPHAPLRACGYLDPAEKKACGDDASRLAAAFDAMGFTAYDDAMLAQVSTLMATAPGLIDFQIDVQADGTLGSTFAIDVQFGIEQPSAVLSSFDQGPSADVMRLLENWSVADDRWRQAIGSAFARAIPVELDDGSRDRFALTLMPRWVKVRWTNAVLQPSKLYHLACGGLIDERRRKASSLPLT